MRGSVALAALLCASWVQAQPVPSPSDLQRAADAERQAREREQQQQRQLQPTADVRRQPNAAARDMRRLSPNEQPCFLIKEVQFIGAQGTDIDPAALMAALNGPQADDPPQGQCVGAQGVGLLIERAQDTLIAQGYVTSRVLAPPQDLSAGQLQLQVLPGRIAAIRLAQPNDRATLVNALPMGPGDVLNLRDVEQALENLKRVPTVETDIQIEPAAQPGQSNLVIRWAQAQPFRLFLSVDDSGDKASGKYQGSATLSYDNALTLNDLLYVTASRDLGGGDPGTRGTRGFNAHYSLPLGYWLLGFNVGNSRYHQTVAGASQDYLYSGNSRQQDIQLSHLFHRDAFSKTSWSLKAFARQSQNFIDDTEIEVQRRRVGGYELGLQHKTQWGKTQIEANLAFQRGTKAFGANQAPEEPFGEGTHQFKLLKANASWHTPFTLGTQRWHYHGQWRWQHNRTPLTPQDRFSIGGRYTVRGFDGQSSLSAERGWLNRNEISTAINGSGHQLVLALDHGRVSGPSAAFLLGQRLTGASVGLRGQLGAVYYDVFVGAPLSKPEGFRTARTTYGISLSASF